MAAYALRSERANTAQAYVIVSPYISNFQTRPTKHPEKDMALATPFAIAELWKYGHFRKFVLNC